MYWRIRDLLGSTNLVALCAADLDDTLPHFTGVQWDSVWATHGVSAEAYAWNTALGCGRTWPDSLTASWTVAIRGAFMAHVCRVVRFDPLQGVLLVRISATPSQMGDGSLAISKHSNWTSFMIDVAYEIGVVDDNPLYQTWLITLACLV
jgi:hypothetical protein